jgi:signal transduction histidine kinase
MTDLVEAIRALHPWIFGAVALATLRRWVRYRDEASAWAAAMFGVLGGVVIASRLLPEGDDAVLWQRQLVIAGLVVFPYLLFRFAATFRRPRQPLRVAAAVLTAVVSGAVFLFGDLPTGDEPRTATFTAYVVAVLVHWVGLSALVLTWLWHGGKGKPTVIRRRMRLLAAAVGGLALALLLAAFPSEGDADAVDLVVALLVAATAGLFFLGLAPPSLILMQWRRSAEEEARRVEAALVAATRAEEVGEAMLPHVAHTMGSDLAVLTDPEGTVIASYGADHEEAAQLVARTGARSSASALSVPMVSGRLLVARDRYTPFFGQEEEAALERLASLTDVALRRAALTEQERRTAAELEQANIAMREFVAVASHDLRTPIAVIKGYAATIRTGWDDLPDDEKLDDLATIGRQADHLSRIVSDLLTTSQIDTGAVEPEPERVDLGAVIDEVLADLDRRHEVEVTVDGAPEVWVDEEHAIRVVRNLVENAFSHGDPPVSISATANSSHLELRVRDHGPGVPEDFQPRLFDRFARADKAKSRSKHGTGLGLSIVRGLARAGGGDAWYEPADTGACFAVRWPRTEGEGEGG